MKQLLFLCTGNYYRSRYAELLFNAQAAAARLPWQAQSRALNLAAGAGNVGPLSPFVVERMRQRGLPLPSPIRYPLQAVEADFEAAEPVIALKEAEHRPMVAARFGPWVHTVEYWRVDDIDVAPPNRALALIEHNIGELLARLAAGD